MKYPQILSWILEFCSKFQDKTIIIQVIIQGKPNYIDLNRKSRKKLSTRLERGNFNLKFRSLFLKIAPKLKINSFVIRSPQKRYKYLFLLTIPIKKVSCILQKINRIFFQLRKGLQENENSFSGLKE